MKLKLKLIPLRWKRMLVVVPITATAGALVRILTESFWWEIVAILVLTVIMGFVFDFYGWEKR